VGHTGVPFETLKMFNMLTWTKELRSPSNSTICSVSTKLATLPWTSMPLVKSRVPARKQQRRETIVHKNGLPFSEHWLIAITGFSSLRKPYVYQTVHIFATSWNASKICRTHVTIQPFFHWLTKHASFII